MHTDLCTPVSWGCRTITMGLQDHHRGAAEFHPSPWLMASESNGPSSCSALKPCLVLKQFSSPLCASCRSTETTNDTIPGSVLIGVGVGTVLHPGRARGKIKGSPRDWCTSKASPYTGITPHFLIRNNKTKKR